MQFKGLPQSTVDNHITSYIVKGIQPLRTVETAAFRELVTGLAPGAAVMSRGTLSKRITDKREKMLFDLKEHMSAAKYICTTADAWSTCGRGYLGVTAHWIAENTLKRHSAALACRRLVGSHSYDVLAEAITDIYNEYGLTVHSRIVGCVTDNGSNFLKAFREFGVELDVNNTEHGDDDGDEPVADDLSFDALQTVLDTNSCDHDTSVVVLPPHHSCSSHTLSLIVANDILEALKDNATLKRIYNSTMAKCSGLWNCASRSTKCCEAIENLVHRKLVRPCPTRWNSLYDSLRVLKSLRADMKAVCEAVGIPVFRDVELDFIDEYVDVLYPVAVALDRLQGQKSESMSFMGALIPTLLTVKQKLTDLTVSPSIRHCLPMAMVVLHALNRRFGMLINLQSEANDYIIAAVSHPYFKLRWVPAEHMERCRLLFSRR